MHQKPNVHLKYHRYTWKLLCVYGGNSANIYMTNMMSLVSTLYTVMLYAYKNDNVNDDNNNIFF